MNKKKNNNSNYFTSLPDSRISIASLLKHQAQHATLSQHNIKVGDINVEFPFEPYSTQVEIIEKTIEAITRKENALIESPTGSGKTLALLCASLAWLKKKLHGRQEKKIKQMSKIPLSQCNLSFTQIIQITLIDY